MNSTLSAQPRTATTPAATPVLQPNHEGAPRVDLYAAIHKALRSNMSDTLVRIGRMDVADDEDMARALAQLQALMAMCERHIAHENKFVHTAIEARQPTGSTRIAEEHVEHLDSISGLRHEAAALASAAAAQRPMLALRLYRHLALFAAENFQHMHHEETAHNAALWAHYSDAELMDLHARLVADIAPHDNLEIARWMLPAVSPAEAVMIARGVQSGMPPEAFIGVLDHVRPHFNDDAWNKLARGLGIAQQPGLVHFA